MNKKDYQTKVTPENADTKKQPRLVTLAVTGAFALVAALVLAGCMHDDENQWNWEMKEVLEGSEVPASLENCELREDFGGEVEDSSDDEGVEPEYTAIEFGLQFLAPPGNEYCEDASYLIVVSMARYSSSDFEKVKKENEEIYNTDNEWDDSGYDYCQYSMTMWGDGRVVSATPMDPRMLTGEWDGTEDPMTGHEDDYQKVRAALTKKYPNMDGPC